MMSRYFIVVKIPSETVDVIKTYFKDKIGREMSATHIHMSLMPPLYLNEGYVEDDLVKIIRDLKWNPFVAKFVGIKTSKQKMRKYLFLKVGPEDVCHDLSSKVEAKLNGMIKVDKKPYLNEVVPEFEAHVTIDYNFEGEIVGDIPDIAFNIDKINVAKELDGEWVDLI